MCEKCGCHGKSFEEQVREVIAAVRPMLQRDGGDVKRQVRESQHFHEPYQPSYKRPENQAFPALARAEERLSFEFLTPVYGMELLAESHQGGQAIGSVCGEYEPYGFYKRVDVKNHAYCLWAKVDKAGWG